MTPGSTTSGKTKIAFELAKRLARVEIISVDSRQVFRLMDIGTAKPTLGQKNQCPHHFIMYYGPNLGTFGHDGYGGYFGCTDPDSTVVLSLTKILLHSGIPARFDTLTKPKFVETVYGNM